MHERSLGKMHAIHDLNKLYNRLIIHNAYASHRDGGHHSIGYFDREAHHLPSPSFVSKSNSCGVSLITSNTCSGTTILCFVSSTVSHACCLR